MYQLQARTALYERQHPHQSLRGTKAHKPVLTGSEGKVTWPLGPRVGFTRDTNALLLSGPHSPTTRMCRNSINMQEYGSIRSPC